MVEYTPAMTSTTGFTLGNGAGIVMSGGVASLSGTTDGWYPALYSSAVSSESWSVSAVVSGTPTSVPAGIIIRGISSFAQQVAILWGSAATYVVLVAGGAATSSTVEETFGTVFASGDVCTVDVSGTGTSTVYTVYRNGTSIGSWPDTGGVTSSGASYRLGGVVVQRNSFTNSCSVSNLIIADSAVAATDTGSGVDAGTVRAPAADTGAGADAGTVAAAAADTGSGTDTAVTAAAVPVSDTGAGADTGQAAAQIPTSDAGSGTDTQTTAVPAGDSGGGADAVTVTAQTPATDTGSGADTLVTGMQETDTGTDSADVAVIAAGAADTGSGADTSTSVAQITAADAGSGSDSGIADIQQPAGDIGSGADAAVVAVGVPAADAGSGTEATGTVVGAPDTGSGTDIAVGELAGIQVPPDMLIYVVPPAYRVPA